MDIEVDFKEIDKLLTDLKKEIKKVDGVEVGWLEDEKALDHDRNKTDIPQWQVVQTLDFGSLEKNIPPRPFVRGAVWDNEKKYNRRIKALMDKEIPFEKVAMQFAETVKNDIRAKIDSNMPPPNTPKTIESKGSSHTLIDTGHMRNSIHTQLLRKKS